MISASNGKGHRLRGAIAARKRRRILEETKKHCEKLNTYLPINSLTGLYTNIELYLTSGYSKSNLKYDVI